MAEPIKIRKFLDLSTAHLPEPITNGLNGYQSVIFHSFEFGGLLWVPDEPDLPENDPDEDLPAEVLRIWRYARSLGCDYVLLDRDGPINADLPTWEWT
jgi:hypothetical protein